MSKKFVRTDSVRYSKLGKKRKKLRVWRKAKGRDNKIRLKRFGYPKSPTVGHKSSKKESGKISGLKPVLVHNVKDLSLLDKNSVVIIAKVGAKKKLDIIKKAQDLGLKMLNLQEDKTK